MGENVITIQLDELEFQTELINSMSAEMLAELNDSTKKLARMKKPLTEEKLIAVGNKLEDQLEQYC